MPDTTDFIIFALVVLARFLLPLLIPRYPLPAVIACLLLDGVDQTIFQVFTSLPLEGYQSYDKALDIYYLSIAYISTLRNWSNLFAFRVSRFLYYYRLVGVVLFETTHLRPILLIFPNTFEYFFIWYEALKLWWNPRRLTRVASVSAAAAIWIIIKLPQEYWIHVAQNDVTDTIKALLGGAPEDAWGPLITANLLPILLVLAAAVLLIVLAWRFLRRNTPPADYKLGLRADDNNPPPTAARFAAARRRIYRTIFDRELFEKAVLVAFIVYIFSNILPNTTLPGGQIVISMALFVVITTALSHILARRGVTITRSFVHLLTIFAVNMAVVYLLQLLRSSPINWSNVIIFQALLAVIVTLYDRYLPFHVARFHVTEEEVNPQISQMAQI